MSTAPVKGPEGEILGGVEITQDITHQKELERRAGIADVKAELYVDILTHDIANLNTALMGYLELLHQKVCTDTLAASHLDKSLRVLQASNDLISIIQRVQSAGEGAREREDLGEMIHAVASELPVPPGRTVHLEQESEEGLMVECNGLLREVFVNLLNNAIVHTKGEVHVRVEAKRVDDRAIVSVENDGEGIDDASRRACSTAACEVPAWHRARVWGCSSSERWWRTTAAMSGWRTAWPATAPKGSGSSYRCRWWARRAAGGGTPSPWAAARPPHERSCCTKVR